MRRIKYWNFKIPMINKVPSWSIKISNCNLNSLARVFAFIYIAWTQSLKNIVKKYKCRL